MNSGNRGCNGCAQVLCDSEGHTQSALPAAQTLPLEAATLPDTSLGDLVAAHPHFASVLEGYRLDYCCGGRKTLGQACEQMGLPIEEVTERLIEAASGAPVDDRDWSTADLIPLMEHIVSTYHRSLYQKLPRLSELSKEVAGVHGEKHPELNELVELILTFKQHIELHLQKEEMILFPAIAGLAVGAGARVFGCGGGIERPIEVMTQEHDDAGELFASMRRLTNNFAAPDDACSSFKILLQSIAELETETHQHVHKENNILFPRALKLATTAMSEEHGPCGPCSGCC